jgi:hypothetical protein
VTAMTLTKTLMLFCGTWVMFLAAANAYYDPGVQRWLNRDPFEDHGFQELLPPGSARSRPFGDGNPQAFVENDPLDRLDAWGLEATFKGCVRRQIEAIKQALKDECDKAKECAAKCPSSDKVKSGMETVCDGNLTFNCVGEDFQFSDGETCKRYCGRTRKSTKEIYLCPDAFSQTVCGGRVACTVFHEGIHLGGLEHAKQGSKVKEPPDFNQIKNCLGCK